MRPKPITPIPVSEPPGQRCQVCTRLASNLPPSLLEIVDVLLTKPGAGNREIIAAAVFLGYMAGREGRG